MCAGKKKGCSTLADEGRYPEALLAKGLPTNAPGERDGSLDLSRLARAAVQSEVRSAKRQTRCLQQLDLPRRVERAWRTETPIGGSGSGASVVRPCVQPP